MTTVAIQHEEKLQEMAKRVYHDSGLGARETLARMILLDKNLLEHILSKVAYQALLEVQRKLRHDIVKQTWEPKKFTKGLQRAKQRSGG